MQCGDYNIYKSKIDDKNCTKAWRGKNELYYFKFLILYLKVNYDKDMYTTILKQQLRKLMRIINEGDIMK